MGVTGNYERPHLRFPVRRGSYVEQDSDEHEQSRAELVISCPVGWRTERPEFGWRFPLFRNAPLDTTSLEHALRQFADVEVARIDEFADAANAAVRRMDVYLQSTEAGGNQRG